MISPSYSFVAGDRGNWEVTSMVHLAGQCLEPVPYMDIRNEYLTRLPVDFRWLLRGVTSNQRYAGNAVEPGSHAGGRNLAAFIPLKKNKAWWAMSQEDRREVFEENSADLKKGMKHLPCIVRKLHDCRDLGEPFDFLAWFEYAPETSSAFEEMVASLRETEEWKFVEREADVRLVKSGMSLMDF